MSREHGLYLRFNGSKFDFHTDKNDKSEMNLIFVRGGSFRILHSFKYLKDHGDRVSDFPDEYTLFHISHYTHENPTFVPLPTVLRDSNLLEHYPKTGLCANKTQMLISCQPNLSLEINRKVYLGWEYMEIKKVGDHYTIYSIAHKKYLGMNDRGNVSFNYNENQVETWFYFLEVRGSLIRIINFRFNYVLSPNSPLSRPISESNDDDLFEIKSDYNGWSNVRELPTVNQSLRNIGLFNFALNAWASAQKNGNLEVNRVFTDVLNDLVPWEKFEVRRHRDGRITIRSEAHNNYLGINNYEASFRNWNVNENTLFTAEHVEGYSFRLKIGNRYISSVPNSFTSWEADDATVFDLRFVR